MHIKQLLKRDSTKHLCQKSLKPYAGSSVHQNIVLTCQGCGFDPQLGYLPESTNECLNKENNKSMVLSLSSINNILKNYYLKKEKSHINDLCLRLKQISMKQKTKKITETRFFEKAIKLIETLVREKGDKVQIAHIGNESCDINTDPTRIIREYHEQFVGSKFDNLDEIDVS